MNIDYFIEKTKNMETNGRGGNKKCYIIDNYALLVGSSVDRNEAAIEKINRLKKLSEKGINIVLVLETRRVGETDYELQEKAPGEELYSYYDMKDSEKGQLKYLKRLISLSEEDISFYEKFLSDWDILLQSQISVDPSKQSNFFYEEKKGIYFVDLNTTSSSYERRKEKIYYEIATVLRGGSLLYVCDLVKDEAYKALTKIYEKLGLSVINLGWDIDDYINQVDPNNEFNLNAYFQENITK